MNNYVLEIYPDDSPDVDQYNQLIEENPDGDEVDQPNRVRSTKEQVDVMDKLMNDGIDDDEWNDLAVQLNDLGPPVRSADNWKRVWTVRKSRKKQSKNQQPDQQPVVGISPNVTGSCDSFAPGTHLDPLHTEKTIIYRLERLETELIKTNKILQSELGKTNALLEIIAKKYM